MGVVITAVTALTVGSLLGRLHPWQRLGDWASYLVRFTGPWVRCNASRQPVVVLAPVLSTASEPMPARRAVG